MSGQLGSNQSPSNSSQGSARALQAHFSTLGIDLSAERLTPSHVHGHLDPRLVRQSDFIEVDPHVGRPVIVYLPPGYAESDRRYPVLYMQDGQNLFDTHSGFMGKSWNLQKTLDKLIAEGKMEPIIVVGVWAGADRIKEYTHVQETDGMGGGGEQYVQFLVKELKPFIDEKYRTLAAREFTAVGGASLGALVSLKSGLDHTEVFSRVAALSPSLFWGDFQLTKEIEHASKKHDIKIWLNIGTEEGGALSNSGEAVMHTRAFADLLKRLGWRDNHDLHFHPEPGAKHNETAWGNAMAKILPLIFPVGFAVG